MPKNKDWWSLSVILLATLIILYGLVFFAAFVVHRRSIISPVRSSLLQRGPVLREFGRVHG